MARCPTQQPAAETALSIADRMAEKAQQKAAAKEKAQSQSPGGWVHDVDWGTNLNYSFETFGEKEEAANKADHAKDSRGLKEAERKSLQPWERPLTMEEDRVRQETMTASMGPKKTLTPVEKVNSVTYPAGEWITSLALEEGLEGLGKVGKAFSKSLFGLGVIWDILGNPSEAY